MWVPVRNSPYSNGSGSNSRELSGLCTCSDAERERSLSEVNEGNASRDLSDACSRTIVRGAGGERPLPACGGGACPIVVLESLADNSVLKDPLLPDLWTGDFLSCVPPTALLMGESEVFSFFRRLGAPSLNACAVFSLAFWSFLVAPAVEPIEQCSL
jgi:hypothetical protein